MNEVYEAFLSTCCLCSCIFLLFVGLVFCLSPSYHTLFFLLVHYLPSCLTPTFPPPALSTGFPCPVCPHCPSTFFHPSVTASPPPFHLCVFFPLYLPLSPCVFLVHVTPAPNFSLSVSLYLSLPCCRPWSAVSAASG